ncbi:DUF6427 family protein [Ascidiimonas sp. W6]|uniref:DUF6427 family protein n=1 Tax=Ascidiimonas meishanensis TaxID=3128903 RepID=UPI0030EE5DE5
MILSSIFGKTKPINFILLTTYLLLVLGVVVFLGLRSFETTVPFTHYALAFSLTTISIFVIEFICKKNNLALNNNYVIYFFCMLIAVFPALFIYPQIAIASWFILLAVRKMITLKSQIGIKRKIFDAAFWIAIAALCYNWSIMVSIPLYVAIAIYAGNDIKNLIIPIIAFSTVLILTYTGFLWFDQQAEFKSLLSFEMVLSKEEYTRSYLLLPSIFLGLLIIASVLTYFLKVKLKTTSVKNSLLLVLLTLVVLIVGIGFGTKLEGASYALLGFPLSIFAGNYVEQLSKKWMKEAILWIFLLLPFINLLL